MKFIFTHLKLCLATVTNNFKVKITYTLYNFNENICQFAKLLHISLTNILLLKDK